MPANEIADATPDPQTAADSLTVDEAVQLCAIGMNILLAHGFDGCTLMLLGEMLVGMADGGFDASDMQRERHALTAELARLRPLVREAGYQKQLAYSVASRGGKVGGA